MRKTNLYWVEMKAAAVRHFAAEIEADTEEQARAEAIARYGKAEGFKIVKIKKQFA